MSETTDQGLAAVRSRIALLLVFRGVALAAGLSFALILPLIDLVLKGEKDLASGSFTGFLAGEGLVLAFSLPAAAKGFPLTTLIHVAISLGWVYWLWVYAQPAWHQMWLSVPFLAGYS